MREDALASEGAGSVSKPSGVLKNSFALFCVPEQGAENVVFVVFPHCLGPLLDRRPGRQRLFSTACTVSQTEAEPKENRVAFL